MRVRPRCASSAAGRGLALAGSRPEAGPYRHGGGGSLTAEAGKLAEYRAAVLAQAGKSITAARAQLLVTFSYGL